MLDINPIKKEKESQDNKQDLNSQGEQSSVNASNTEPEEGVDQKPLKTVGPDFLKRASQTPEPSFLEKEDASRLTFYFTLFVAIIVLGTTGYLYFLKKTKGEELKTKEKVQSELEAQINSPELTTIDQAASRYSIGLKQLNKLITKPIHYSLLFDHLEQIIPTEVTLTSLNIDEKGAVKITAQAPELESTAKFIKSLENSRFFKSIYLNSDQLSSTKDEENQYYTVTVQGTLNDSILVENNTEEK